MAMTTIDVRVNTNVSLGTRRIEGFFNAIPIIIVTRCYIRLGPSCGCLRGNVIMTLHLLLVVVIIVWDFHEWAFEKGT
jgi:hypothetical protein